MEKTVCAPVCLYTPHWERTSSWKPNIYKRALKVLVFTVGCRDTVRRTDGNVTILLL